jgi:tetratricopeptide (TPR) repeat protein
VYAAAFVAEPELADDRIVRHRSNAACSAALAAAGQGEDAAKLDDKERTRLRQQALDWLRADLALLTKQIRSSNPGEIQKVWMVLDHWQRDTDLAGIRDKAALDKLSAEEQKAFAQFWVDVWALRTGPAGPAPVTRQQEQGHACRGDWSTAVAGYAMLLAAQPLDGELGFEYAAVLLLSGDQTGYRKTCRELLDRSGKGSGQGRVRPYHVARACTLAPDSVKDPALPGKQADAELKQNKGEFWSLTEQGALAYRAGRYDEAATLLEQSLNADSKPGRAVVSWLWLSLVEHRRGKPAEARAWLDKATKWLEHYPKGIPPVPNDATGLHLHNWLEAQVLRREAEALIGPKKSWRIR